MADNQLLPVRGFFGLGGANRVDLRPELLRLCQLLPDQGVTLCLVPSRGHIGFVPVPLCDATVSAINSVPETCES